MPDTYNTQTNPGLGQVDKQGVLSPALGSLNFFQRKVGSVLLKVNLDDQGNTKLPHIKRSDKMIAQLSNCKTTHASRLPWCLESRARASSLCP